MKIDTDIPHFIIRRLTQVIFQFKIRFNKMNGEIMKRALISLFRTNKSRKVNKYEITPRKLMKTLRNDLVMANRKDLAPIPEEIYMTVVKMFPNTSANQKMKLAEKIDNIFLNLPNGD
jgi:hypothetical protein